MRYDPEARQEKYRSIVSTLKTDGFISTVQTQKNYVDCAFVSHPRFSDSKIAVYRRERGWFLGIPRPMSCEYYSVPSEQAVIAILRLAREAGAPLNWELAPSIVDEFALGSVSRHEWSLGETREDYAIWARFGWDQLTDIEYYDIAQRFESKFFPQEDFVLPKPSRTWRLGKLYRLPDGQFEAAEGALTMHALCAFQACIAPGERILVMDWNHPCFHFDVHRGIRRPYRDEWAISILHDAGDSHLFMTPDFEMGIFGLGNSKLCVFGKRLLDAFLRNAPTHLL